MFACFIDRLNSVRTLALVALLVACAPLSPAPSAQPLAPPPPTPVRVVADTLHGVVLEDPYRWLEDQQAPETRTWIEAQNAYTTANLDRFPFRKEVAARLGEILKVDRFTSPIERGGRYFFQRRMPDQEQYVLYVREGLNGPDRVLIDPHTLSPDFTTSVSIMDVSADGTLLAYALRKGGEDEVEIRFLDVASGRETAEALPRNNYYGLSIAPDKERCYYSVHDERGTLLSAHRFGTVISADPVLFGQGLPPEKILETSLSEDGRYLLIHVYEGSAGTRNEVYYSDILAGGRILPLVTDVDANFFGQIGGDRVYMSSNWNAPNWRILAADLKNPARENWVEVVPNGKAVIESFSLVGGRIYVNYLDEVKSRVQIFEADGRPAGEIRFPTIGSIDALSGRWEGREAFFSFQSFHVPLTIYRYDVAGGTQEVWARTNTPIDTERIEVEQVWFNSKDGTRVPMFLIHRKGLVADGACPTLLTGYGGFNVSWTPYFSPSAAYWVDQGGLYAIPSLRGGGEFGDEWHRAAMHEKKQNSFDDFIAAAEWLIAHKYTNPSRLAVLGGSNGGLLVGAFLTQRPELCHAVVCTYPLLDMLRFHKTLKGPYWVSEYGSADDPEQFAYIRAYSPYHNVRPGTAYPAVLFVTGDADTRVDPMHARKMTALLQAATGSKNPVMLYYDTRAGHSGGDPASKEIEELEVRLSFLMSQLGVEL